MDTSRKRVKELRQVTEILKMTVKNILEASTGAGGFWVPDDQYRMAHEREERKIAEKQRLLQAWNHLMIG